MDCPLNRTWFNDFLSTGYPVIRYRADKVSDGDFVNFPLCLITLLTRTVSFLRIILTSRADGV